MKLINEVHVSGFVATEPQQSGRGPHRFRLSHGGGKKKDGSSWPTQFFSVSVWDDKIVPTKGQRVELWGKLRQNDYTDKNGNNRDSVEIVADAIQADEPAPLTPDFTKSGMTAARAILAPSKTTTKNAHGVEVSDDDIPF
jgi:single-stranded DNA-binding protein